MRPKLKSFPILATAILLALLIRNIAVADYLDAQADMESVRATLSSQGVDGFVGVSNMSYNDMVRETSEWRGCQIRLLRIVRGVDEMEGSEHEMVDLIESSRIDAKVTIVHSKGAPFDVIAEESGQSHLVFLGVGGFFGYKALNQPSTEETKGADVSGAAAEKKIPAGQQPAAEASS